MNDTLSDNYRGVWGLRLGFGRRPALLAIDFMQASHRRRARSRRAW